MGVYIKDYEIPSGECEHLMLDFTTMKACALFGDRKMYDIVSVKAPHGELIDRDTLKAYIYDYASDEPSEMEEDIDEIPTVIEAEVK